MNNINKDINLPAEWVAQDAILIAWPHAATDWDYILEETVACYKQIAEHILDCEDLIVVTPNVEQARCTFIASTPTTHGPVTLVP